MNSLHLILDESSPAIQWANTQADKVGARGHVGTHLDCYSTIPRMAEYTLPALVLDCRKIMPLQKDIHPIDSLENKALLLHTGNLEDNGYGTDSYFNKDTSLTPNTLQAILLKKPTFIIIDSHGIGEKGEKHISFDKLCEANGCHVIENADLTLLEDTSEILLKVQIDIHHPSTGKPCRLYRIL